MGIVYGDEINGHDSAYFSVDRMGGIQYNTDMCFCFDNSARRSLATRREPSTALTQYKNILIEDLT